MTERKRKWLVPVVVKTIVWETATVTVTADHETQAMLKAIENDVDDLEYGGDEINREIRVDRVQKDIPVELVSP